MTKLTKSGRPDKRFSKTPPIGRHPLYAVWSQMTHRCYNESNAGFINYGARGIIVCDRWLHGEDGKHPCLCFAEDMGERPEGFTLDRVDNDGNYEPSNCKWSSKSDQMKNRRSYGGIMGLPTDHEYRKQFQSGKITSPVVMREIYKLMG